MASIRALDLEWEVGSPSDGHAQGQVSEKRRSTVPGTVHVASTVELHVGHEDSHWMDAWTTTIDNPVDSRITGPFLLQVPMNFPFGTGTLR